MPSIKSLIVLGCAWSCLTANVRAEEARTILEKAIQAHGGEARIARTKIGRLKAAVEGSFAGAGAFKATWEETFDLPRRYRRVIEGSEAGQPFHREFAANETEGWMRLGPNAPQVFPVRETLPIEQHWHAVLLQLILLKDKDTRLTALPEEQRNGRSFIGIRAASPRGEAELYFDKSTGLLARARRPMPNLMTGREMVAETIYDEYRDIGGVRYPMHMKTSNGDTYSLNITLSSLSFLDDLDPRVFAKPDVARPHEADVATGKQAEADAEDKMILPAGPNAATTPRWDIRLIVATLSVGAVVGVVWLIVHVSRRRSQETPRV